MLGWDQPQDTLRNETPGSQGKIWVSRGTNRGPLSAPGDVAGTRGVLQACPAGHDHGTLQGADAEGAVCLGSRQEGLLHAQQELHQHGVRGACARLPACWAPLYDGAQERASVPHRPAIIYLRHQLCSRFLSPSPMRRTPRLVTTGRKVLAGVLGEATASKFILGLNVKTVKVSGQSLEETESNVLHSEKQFQRKNLHERS